MKKIIIIFTTFCLILGVFLLKANTNGFNFLFTSTAKINNAPVMNPVAKAITSKASKKRFKVDDDTYSNYICADSVFLYGGPGFLKITDITSATALTAFGTPSSTRTEFSEVDDANVLIYDYPAAELSFLNGELINVDVTDEGFSFEFVLPDGKRWLVTPGSEAFDLHNNFTSSYENGSGHNVHLFLKTPSGFKTDGDIVFGLLLDINSDISNTIHTLTLRM